MLLQEDFTRLCLSIQIAHIEVIQELCCYAIFNALFTSIAERLERRRDLDNRMSFCIDYYQTAYPR